MPQRSSNSATLRPGTPLLRASRTAQQETQLVVIASASADENGRIMIKPRKIAYVLARGPTLLPLES